MRGRNARSRTAGCHDLVCKMMHWLMPTRSGNTRLHHFPQNTPQIVVLQRGRHPFLVGELLIDLIILLVRAVLDPDIDPEVWRQQFLQAHPDGETYDSCQGTMSDGWRDLD
jgi:hypothetical protein